MVILLAMFAMLEPFHFSAAAAPSWSSPILVDTHRGLDILPSALQASNGTMWLAWESDRNDLSNARFDIIYKTYTNGLWSNDYNLTTSGNNASPSLVQLVNGTILVFWVMKPARSYEVFYESLVGNTWSAPSQVTTTTLNDTLNAAAVNNRDGSLWLVWTRVNSSCACAAIKQLYYKTLKNGVWSSDIQLTNDSNQNYGASVLISKDGIVRVAWSKGAAGSNYQLFYEAYNSTSGSWSSSSQVVSSSSTDEHPSLIQDRNGTLWLFWSRLIVVSLLVQYYVLYGKYSYDLGKTWSGEIQLTNTSNTVDSQMPSAVQSTYGVKPLWIFYSSNLNVPDNDIYAVMSTGVYPVHDVIVTGFSVSNNLEYPGGLKSMGQSAIVIVAVTVRNIGDSLEYPNVTLTATNRTSIPIGTVRNPLGPGNAMNFYFNWNTTGVPPGRYGFAVTITPLPGESAGNLPDNSGSVTNQVHILPFGDVDMDGAVTITDVSVMFYNYGFLVGSVHNGYTIPPQADVDGNGIIDIVDVGTATRNYGTYT
jgi:hypothetical protein